MLTVNHGDRVDERLAGGEMRLVDGVARRRQRQANGDGVRLLVDGGSPAACACSVCVRPLLNAYVLFFAPGSRWPYIVREAGTLTLGQANV